MNFLVSRYDPWMIAISIAIAVFASYLALDLAKRVRSGNRRVARRWWLGGSIVLGTGIWSMHFVGMLAFSLPIELGYARLLTAASWASAVSVSAVALGIAAGGSLGWRRLATGSLTMGLGIFAMHYLGMAALDMQPGIVWNAWLVAASFAVAVLAAAASLTIFFWLRRAGDRREPVYQALASLVMGAAICGMHYTGMAAASFPVGSFCLSAGGLGGDGLRALVAGSAAALLLITTLTSILDARGRHRIERMAASLREANVRLEREGQRYAVLAQLSTDWFWEQDAERRFTEVSLPSAELAGAGVSRERLLGHTYAELGWTPVQGGSTETQLAQIARREPYRDLRIQRVDDDGALRFVSHSGAPFVDAEGRVAGWYGVARDITEQVREERRGVLRQRIGGALAQVQAAEALLEEFVDAVCACTGWQRSHDEPSRGGDGAAGGSFVCTIGSRERTFAEISFRVPGASADDPATMAVVRDLAQQIGSVLAHRDAENEVRHERALLAARVEERTRDLSRSNEELELAKAGAEAANEAKSRFLATMSHEIRTPMNGVVGMVEVLSQSPLTAEQEDAVRTIRTSSFSLLALIDDILDFSKIEAGHMEVERAPVELAGLMEGVCDMLAPDAAARGVALNAFVAPDLPERIWSDATRLRQAIGNLVANAVKFSAGRPDIPGRVSVRVDRARAQPRRLSISVADNGIGISVAHLGHLFAPFAQAESSSTRRFGGTGLGLVICKRIVDLLGGDIEVESLEGIGSTFTVTLPLEAVEGDPLRPARRLDGLSCVLVASPHLPVDDLRVYLEHAGARVHVASGIHAAVRHVAGCGAETVVIQPTGAELRSQLKARAAFAAAPGVRHVVIARHGRMSRPEAVLPGMVALAESGLRRHPLLAAVAMASGREAVAVPPPVPAREPAAGRRMPPSIAEARATRRLVLVAEDDPVNQRVIVKQLALLGYAAELAADGAEALALWREGGHGLLLTDLHMPRMDGYRLTASIRAAEAGDPAKPRMPILALTANALRDEAARGRAAGMDEYLTKPIRLPDLDAAIGRWLAPAGDAASDAFVPGSPTVPPSSSGSTAPIDVSALQALVGDDPATVREFLDDFRTAVRERGREIVSAAGRADLVVVGRMAHALKASSRAVGAMALGECCAELEAAAKTGPAAEVERLSQEFARLGDLVEQALAARLDPQAA